MKSRFYLLGAATCVVLYFIAQNLFDAPAQVTAPSGAALFALTDPAAIPGKSRGREQSRCTYKQATRIRSACKHESHRVVHGVACGHICRRVDLHFS